MKKNKKNNPNQTIINKKARYNFFIEEIFEAGIILLGWEVKSARKGMINIVNSYVSFKLNSAYLIGSQFFPISNSNLFTTYESTRSRQILLHKHEIVYLYNKIYKNKCTVVVLSVFFKRNWCKVKIGLAKGKKITDKRIHSKQCEWKKTKNKLLKHSID